MNIKAKSGRFITIDGPNGVGKTTITLLVCQQLKALGYEVFQTREPTKTFDRANEEKHGVALAHLIVEDRRHHLVHEVKPMLKKIGFVVCERYIESSLVYRKFDGISFEETWRENMSFRIPDLSILLVAAATTLRKRLKRKLILTRFEREHTSKEELALYYEAHSFLGEHGFNTVTVENGVVARKIVAGRIIRLIFQLI